MTASSVGATGGARRYVLQTRIASGGMAEVWLSRALGAEDRHKTVVLKTIVPASGADFEFVEMMMAEARRASALEHPNIARILDVGEMGEAIYVATEHVAGASIAQLCRALLGEGLVAPLWFTLRVAEEICAALSYASTVAGSPAAAVPFSHQGIDTANVAVSFWGHVKVLDFGIARAALVARRRNPLLQEPRALGRLAPEQLTTPPPGCAANPSSDIYALGVLLHEMLTGSRPFHGEDEASMVRAILASPRSPPSRAAPWIPASVDALVLRALAAKPEDRFPNPEEFRRAIHDCLPAGGVAIGSRELAAYVCKVFEYQDLARHGGVASATVRVLSPDAGGPPSSIRGSSAPSLRMDTSGPCDIAEVLGPEELAAWAIAGPDADSVATPARDSRPAFRIPSAPRIEHIPSTAPLAAEPSGPPRADDEDKRRAWDRMAERARQERTATAPEDPPPPPPPEQERPDIRRKSGHDWDAIVQRARRDSSVTTAVVRDDSAHDGSDDGGSGAAQEHDKRRAPPSAEQREAHARFETGLQRMKDGDLQGALAAWSLAADLDPSNRLVQANLRKLRKMLEGGR